VERYPAWVCSGIFSLCTVGDKVQGSWADTGRNTLGRGGVGILHRLIKRGRCGQKIRSLKVIGIDEILFRKGYKFATLVYEIRRGQKGCYGLEWTVKPKPSCGFSE